MKHSNYLMLSLSLVFVRASAQEFSRAIEDNSYLIEEAYNQEERVVQHIFNGYYLAAGRGILYTFTQEWPLGGQTHQLSYTLAYQFFNGHNSGFGDALINYRYQVLGEGDWCWFAPRLSVVLPTGKSADGLGNGVLGLQFSLPASKRWTNEFVTHLNLGATLLPNVKGESASGDAVRQTLPTYALGASGIYLASENFNLMLELLYTSSGFINPGGSVGYSSVSIISPGFRYAINIGKLQIVPGLAFPASLTPARTDVGVFAYLSFEHPF